MALKEINQEPVDYNSLYAKVMVMVAEGYNENVLTIAFNYLCENEKAARRFLAKNTKLRKLWMDVYLFTRL